MADEHPTKPTSGLQLRDSCRSILPPQTPRDNRNVALACILVAVIILTCAMSYWQEHAAESVMNSLLQLIPTECAVIRDGVESRVKAIEVTHSTHSTEHEPR